jgi:hypothetical protein
MTTGQWCNGFGVQALQNATTPVGWNNAFGTSCLLGLTTGSYNTAIWHGAGYAVGPPGTGQANQLTTGSHCTFIGLQSGHGSSTQLNYVTALGSEAPAVLYANSVTLGRIGTDVVYLGEIVLGNNATPRTVATLPAASAALQGARSFVSDAASPSFLGALTGGGSTVCPVFCNWAAWVAG